jgi:hypothetical protein
MAVVPCAFDSKRNTMSARDLLAYFKPAKDPKGHCLDCEGGCFRSPTLLARHIFRGLPDWPSLLFIYRIEQPQLCGNWDNACDMLGRRRTVRLHALACTREQTVREVVGKQ